MQLLRMADPVARAVAATAIDERSEFLRMGEQMRGANPAEIFREMTRAAAASTGRHPALGGGWPVDLSMFVGEEASSSGDQWIRPRPKPGLRLWRLKRLGANVDRGVEPPRALWKSLVLRTLAAPFVLAWYGIGLALVGFFMFVAIFVGLTVFTMVYACVIGLITMIPVLIKLVPVLADLWHDRGE